MRSLLWLVIPLFLAACQCPHDRQTSPLPPPGSATAPAVDLYPGGDNPEEAKLRSDLATTHVEVVAEQEALGTLLDRVAAAWHVNIQPNWPALTTAGIDRQTQLAVHLHGVPIADALREILAQAGGATSPLSYVIEGNIIRISTRDELNSERFRAVRIYPIQDLLLVPIPFVPTLDLQKVSANGRLSPADLFRAPQVSSDAAARITEIRQMIEGTVAPTTWVENGGTIGSMEAFNGLLVINQTAENHRAVVDLLKKLRAELAHQVSVDARFVVVDGKTLHALNLNSGTHILTPVQAAAVAGILDHSNATRTLSAPHLTLFNGQAVLLHTGSLVPCVSTYQSQDIPATTQPNQPATQRYTPEVDAVATGCTLDLSVGITADNGITVAVVPALSRIQGYTTVPAPNVPAAAHVTITRPILDIARFSATVTIPNDHTALVGGIPLTPPDPAQAPLYLFLLVHPTIVSPAE